MSSTFNSVFAFGAVKLFGSGWMIESSCRRGAVSGALFICLAGREVVEKVPLTGYLLCFLSLSLLRGFREVGGEPRNNGVRK